MCLDVKSRQRVKRAKEDIVCYKFLYEVGGRFVTPFMGVIVSEGREYSSNLKKKNSDPEPHCISWIETGLHSFATKEELISYCKAWDRNVYYIAECIIPKGSKYYEGEFFHFRGYASDKIKYIKIQKPEL